MARIGGHHASVVNDADFVAVWNKWLAMGLVSQELYCWSGVQDQTIGQVGGQSPGKVRWGAYGWGYLPIVSGGTSVEVEKFCLSVEAIVTGTSAIPSDITGLPGVVALSCTDVVSGAIIQPTFTPF